MEQGDLLASMTIDQDFFWKGQQHNIMGKDTKGKGNTCAKKVKDRKKCCWKTRHTRINAQLFETPSLLKWVPLDRFHEFMIRKSWFEVIAYVYVSRLALDPLWVLSLGVSPNQEHLSLTARFFLSLTKWSYFFPLWAGIVFIFFTQGLYFGFYFSIRVFLRVFPCGNFVNDICQVCDVNKSMKITLNTSNNRLLQKFPQASHLLTRLWHLPS